MPNEPVVADRGDAEGVIEHLRGRRFSVLRRRLPGARSALDRGSGGAAEELHRQRPPPYWPADPWLHVIYAGGLAAAAVVAIAINWLAPPPLGRAVLAAIAAGLFLAAGLLLARAPARRALELQRVLRDPRDRAAFEAANADAERILLTWPALERMGEPTDPTETLERALWDLIEALAERGSLRAADRELRASVGDPIGAGTLFAAVNDKQVRIAERLAEVDAEIQRRTGQLHRLAEECRGFLEERIAERRARLRITSADALLGALAGRAGRTYEPVESLAERTEAVLGAYRELAADLE